jgi:hypothetical protein
MVGDLARLPIADGRVGVVIAAHAAPLAPGAPDLPGWVREYFRLRS